MKRVLVTLLGGTVLLAGIVMIVLPGPAFLIIPAGLAILATEYLWARRARQWTKRHLVRMRRSWKRRRRPFPREVIAGDARHLRIR